MKVTGGEPDARAAIGKPCGIDYTLGAFAGTHGISDAQPAGILPWRVRHRAISRKVMPAMDGTLTPRRRIVLIPVTLLLLLTLAFTALHAEEPNTPQNGSVPIAPTTSSTGPMNYHPLVHNAPTPTP